MDGNYETPPENGTARRNDAADAASLKRYTPPNLEAPGATVALFGVESAYRTDVGEMNWIGRTPPASADPLPELSKRFIVVADHVEREPVVVETRTGGCYRKVMFSTEVSLVELLLFCERAKARGNTRIKLVVLADAE